MWGGLDAPKMLFRERGVELGMKKGERSDQGRGGEGRGAIQGWSSESKGGGRDSSETANGCVTEVRVSVGPQMWGVGGSHGALCTEELTEAGSGDTASK